jgi:hypothetical protein
MYKIVGTDGRVYGPVSAEQVKQWIAQGRANAQTHALADGAVAWITLGQLPEFANCFSAQVPPISPVPPVSGTIPPFPAGPLRKINGHAILGLVFGILSFACCFMCCINWLFAPLGIIFSLIGLSQVNHHPELYEGRSMAIAGLVLSILSLVIAFILLICFMANGQFHYSYNNHLLR